MPFDRREFLTLMASGMAVGAMARAPVLQAAEAANIKAIAFDGFPILDPRPIFALAKKLSPEKGAALGVAFRTHLFEYQWLRALAGQYQDFYSIIDDALLFAARNLDLELTDNERSRFKQAFLKLKAWPDVAPSLQALKDKGIKLAFLSNMTPDMLNAGIDNSGLQGMFDFVLSTDEIKSFKPDPRAYQLGVDAFGLPKEQIAFAAFAGWDAAGASWFGYPTVWVNRLNSKPEILGTKPAAVVKGLDGLVHFVSARNQAPNP